jgi:hypothetical protein
VSGCLGGTGRPGAPRPGGHPGGGQFVSCELQERVVVATNLLSYHLQVLASDTPSISATAEGGVQGVGEQAGQQRGRRLVAQISEKARRCQPRPGRTTSQ